MNPERWRQVDELFEGALEREGRERAAFLDAACGGDSALRREVEELLGFDARSKDLFDAPVFELAAQLMTADTAALPRRGRAAPDDGRAGPSRMHSSHSSESIDDARFVPGDVLAERYRIAGLLGRGGMGEVYRADDLKLRQAVALKFLPERLSADGPALARFYQEVSVARQISHRHVCRVYDVGESAGQHFISMEYVRGEELSSLLKRIGRLPPDKAAETARQLCAGLAAVHEKGVLHRDLKPANVMIDERGDVRITDFGIAALADDVRGREAMSGTPAYMSPEQLEGGELSVRSDIYSLGLVLYELFTGRRAFEAASLPELLALRRSDTTPTSPSKLVADIDPLVERVVFRCLERDPAKRPATALQVAAALPGGDPLAAALAAGETPSPEMVAATPKEGVLRPAVALSLLAAVVVGLALLMPLAKAAMLHGNVPLQKSPEVLGERAGEIARRLGYTEPPLDTASGFYPDAEYLFYVRDHDQSLNRWDRLRTGRPPALIFWHRQSPGYIEPRRDTVVDLFDPPNTMSGEMTLYLDTTGRLEYFEVVPRQLDEGESAGAAPPDWSVLFREAGLDMAEFRPVESEWTPPRAYDARAAWEGAYPGEPQWPLRVEAAVYRGRPIYFEIVGPWRSPSMQHRSGGAGGETIGFGLLLTMFFGALAVGSALAWRALRRGQGDRRGALRVALFIFATRMLTWVFGAHHTPTLGEVAHTLMTGLQSALFWACFVGLLYLGLEPFLRRRWPHRIVSWTRLLAGDWRDPLVGRDILIGAAFGTAFMLLMCVADVAPGLVGATPNFPSLNAGLEGLGLRAFVPLLMSQVAASLAQTLIWTFLLLFLSMLLRRDRLGIGAGWLLLSALFVLLISYKSPISLPFAVAVCALYVALVARFGVLAMIVAIMFHHLLIFFPITTELSAWYATPFILDVLLLLAIAAYGFHTSLGGQRVLRGGFLED